MSPRAQSLGVHLVVVSALGLEGFLQADCRGLLWFCSHPVLLLCTFVALHVSSASEADSPEVSLDAFCFWKVHLSRLLFCCGFPV